MGYRADRKSRAGARIRGFETMALYPVTPLQHADRVFSPVMRVDLRRSPAGLFVAALVGHPT